MSRWTLAERWEQAVQFFRERWLLILIIATGLTVITEFPSRPWSAIPMAFFGNLVVTLSITVVTTMVYVLLWGGSQLSGVLIKRALGHGVSIALGVLGGTELAFLIFGLIALLGLEIPFERLDIWRVGGVVTVVVIIVSVVYDRLHARAQAQMLRTQQAQQDLLRAQLHNLQARVNPHFLFNAFNTVASLIEEAPEQAVEALERLSVMLRYSLEGTRRGLVPLRRELDSVRGYLSIEQLRYGDRLRTELRVDPDLEAIEVPPFVLQPLVENAVKHGIASRRGGRVTLTVERSEHRLTIEVSDDGPGKTNNPGTQEGHENLRQRLALVYGDEAEFEAGPRPEGGYRVRLVLSTKPRAPSPIAAQATAPPSITIT
ncbi:MAG: histidine kinase [Myxococcota bacterium]